MNNGLVVKAIASFFYVKLSDGSVIECRASKKLKLDKKKIITGDNVEFDPETNYITQIFTRSSELIRPKIANVANVVIVCAATEPKLNFGLLDRMLLIMEKNQLRSTIAMTKLDLLTDTEVISLKQNLEYYQEIGYDVVYTNEASDLERFTTFLCHDKYVFTGQTGVGKSTLINKLIADLNIKTQAISKALGRGKHTTREVTFYDFQDGYIIDTPGFSALDISLTNEDIRDNYIDFFELSSQCKFNGCFHINEPGCQVKANLENNPSYDLRYSNYKKLVLENQYIEYKDKR